MKKTTLRQVALKLAFVAFVLLAPLGLRAQNTQLNEGFEGTTFPPDDWTTIHVSGTNAWARSTGTGNASSSAFAYRKDVSGGYEDYLITPKLVPQSGEELSFYLASQYADDYAGTTLTIEISTTTPDVSAFTNVLATYTSGSSGNFETSGSSDWVSKTVDVSAYVGQEIYIAFHAKDIGYNADVRIDDVTGVSLYVPACPKPTGLTATLTPGNGSIATLNWTENGTATNWELWYGTDENFTDGTYTVLTTGFPYNIENEVTTVTANLTGLTAETQYYAKVKADCGGGDYSDWSSETGISFTPTNAFSLTVNDGTATNAYVPLYAYYDDDPQRSEFIIPASALSTINGNSLTSIKFYPNYDYTTTKTYIVYLKEVTEETFSGTTFYTESDATTVYSGGLTISATDGLTITFNEGAFDYNGGNLLVGLYLAEDVSGYYNSSTCPFYGVNATGASLSQYGSYSTAQRNFLPKVTFAYESNAYPKPKNLSVSGVTAHVANISWVAPSTEVDHYEYQYKPEGGVWTSLTSTTPTTAPLTGLVQNTNYTFQVKAVYSTGESQFASINFATTVACPDPTDLTATSITDDGATLGWTSTASNFNVHYRTAAVPNTLFFDDFENGLSQWTIYTDGGAPQSDGWLTYNPTSDLSYESHSDTYCASAWSWASSAFNANNWLVTPQVPLTGTLKFWVRTNDLYPDSYEVLLSTASNAEADFTEELQAMAVAPANGAWNEVVIDLSSYSGNGYIAIHHVDYDANYLLIDDFGIYGDPTPAGAWTTTTASTNSLPVTGLDEQTTYDFEVQADCGGGEESNWVASTFTTLPSCMPVSTLAVDAATATTIVLTWTDQNNGAATYVVTDNDDNDVTVTNLTTTGCTVTGLTANTAYTFKVKANCGGGFSSAERVEGRTACDAITTVPYVESFENADNNYCWTLDGFSVMNNSSYSYEDDNFIIALNSSTEPRYVVLPEMADDISGLMLNFWWTNYYAGYDLGYLYIGYLTDVNDYTTFEQVGVIDMTSSINVYEQSADYAFTAAPEGSRMALKYVDGNNGGQILIDKVTVDNLAACMRPTDLAVTTPTAHGATFGWTSNGTETAWQLYISENSTAPADNETNVIDADANPFTVASGLDPETEYHVWVRANCNANGYSTWGGPETFTTKCGAINDFPIIYGFEISEGFPSNASTPTTNQLGNCWRNQATVQNGNYPTLVWGTSTLYKHVGSQALILPDKGNSSNPAKTMLVFPAMNFSSSNGYHVSFWIYRNSQSSNPEGFKVYASNTDTIDANAVELGHYSRNYTIAYPVVESTSGWYNYDFYIPQTTLTGTVYLIFEGQSYYGNATYVDDITIEEAPSCFPVGTLAAATNVTATSADLSWTLVDNTQNAWQIDTGDVDHLIDVNLTEATKNDNTVNYTINSLHPSTVYTVKVRANCGTDPGEWSNPIAIETPIACPAPTNLELDSKTEESLTVSWTEGTEGDNSWTVCYKAESEENFHVNTDVTENPYTIEGLTQGTNYTVKVMTNCANGYPSPALVDDFQTVPTCPAPENLKVTDGSVTAHGATITWEGNSENDSYKIEYRTVNFAEFNVTYNFDDNTTQGWTTYDEDGDGYSWSVNNGDANSNPYCVKSRYNSNAVPNNWLISPEIPLGGTLRFYAKRYSSGSGENFQVYVSTTGTDIADFTAISDVTPGSSSYTIYEYDLSSYSGNGYVAIRHTAASNQWYLYIDDINITANVVTGYGEWQPITNITGSSYTFGPETVSLTPETYYQVRVKADCSGTESPYCNNIVGFNTLEACGVPTAFTLGTVTAYEASFSWTAGNGNESWKVYVKKHADAEYPTEYTSATTATATITNLDANTAYDVKIVPNCDATKSLEDEFTTTYENLTLPYSTTFDAANDAEWRLVNSSHVNKWVIGEAAGNGDPTRGLYISNDNGTTNAYNNSGYCIVFAYAGFSNFEASKQYTVSFDWKNKGETGNYDFIRAWLVPDNAVFSANTSDEYPAGMTSATGNPTDWISLDNNTPLKNVTTWQTNTAYVTVPTDGAYKLVFMWRQDNSVGNNPPAAIDNVSIAESEKYTVTVNVNDINMGSVTSTPAVLNDIYENTEVTLEATENEGYHFLNWTNNVNSEDVVNTNPFVFNVSQDITYTANFEINTYTITAAADPIEGGAVSGDGTFDHGTQATLTATANVGYAFVNWTLNDEVVSNIATYTISSVSADGNYVAHFVPTYVINATANPAEGGTVVGAGTYNQGSNATLTATANEGYYFVNWTKGGSEVSTDAEYSFTVTEAGDYVANFAPSCLPVGTLAEASNITATSAELSWTLVDNNQNAWVVEYATDENFTTVQTENATTNTNYQLSNLTPETHYWVRVKANCGNVNGVSLQWSNTVDFTTEACPTPTNVTYSDVTPHGATITWEGEAANHVIEYRTVTTVDVDYTYDFEDGMQGWTTIDADGHGNAWYRGDNYNAHNGTYSMQTQCNSSYGHQDYLVSPQIALGGSISFYAKKAADWYNDRFRVYLSTTSNTSASDFTIELTNGDVSPSVTYSQYSYDLSNYSGMGYVAIVYTAPADQYFISIDDINITGTVVSGYGEWQTVDNATSPHVLNTLAPETNYEVRVVGDCGATTSPASNIVGFTTGVACQAPTELTVGTPTHEQVVLSWTENGEATNWVVAYKAESETEYNELNVTTNPYTLDGLDENTPYSVKVKADCGSTEGTSQWSEEKTFTTAETCAAPTAFTLGTITTNEATFSWTAGNGNTSWDVYVKKHADAEYPATASENVTAATVTINGLDPATVYDVKIVPDCDATKVLEVVNAFTTECETTVVDADNPFFEGFEGTTFPPICWSVGDPSNNNNWQRSTEFSNTGSASAKSDFYGPIYLYTPILHIDGATATLSFSSYNFLANFYEYGRNYVLVSVNGGDWTVIWSPASVSESWVVTTIDMTAYVGQDIQLCFKYEGDFAHSWFIDDVNLYVPTVIEKAIEANKWYAISSPVHNDDDNNETLAGVNNLTSGTYDLYGYTEGTGSWNKPSTVLEQGKGYIYRRSSNTTLNFVGTPNNSVPAYTLSYACDDDYLKGFNLVGNPYPQPATPGMVCYSLKPEGIWYAQPATYQVPVCEAVLVYTDGSNATVSFSAPTPSKSSSDHAALAFTVSNDEFEDVAYARFDNGEGLPKIGHLNSEAPMLSIPVEGRRYAIANLGSDCESFDMVLRAAAGTYTLTFSNELSLGYCHLIDRVAGKDIDMLRQSSYTFTTTGSNATRFMVKLSPNAAETDNSSFVYWNGSAWVVEGNGTLQVFDVLGRKVFSKEVNTEVTIPTSQFPGTGVYIIRLGEKSQKIVVK